MCNCGNALISVICPIVTISCVCTKRMFPTIGPLPQHLARSVPGQPSRGGCVPLHLWWSESSNARLHLQTLERKFGASKAILIGLFYAHCFSTCMWCLGLTWAKQNTGTLEKVPETGFELTTLLSVFLCYNTHCQMCMHYLQNEKVRECFIWNKS